MTVLPLGSSNGMAPARARAAKLMVMPANQTNELVHLWAGEFPGRIGHLYTPARKERVRPWIPYVLDNGRFAEAVNGLPFDQAKFIEHVERYVFLRQRPLWMAVPDVPFNGAETLEWWQEWEPRLRSYDIPLALVVQDGMDVGCLALLRSNDVVFVGGTTEWKWRTVSMWARCWNRVHVGRVNSPERLYELEALGVESCDGSGWFRGKEPQIVGLARFLAESSGRSPDSVIRCASSSRYSSNYSTQHAMSMEEAPTGG